MDIAHFQPPRLHIAPRFTPRRLAWILLFTDIVGLFLCCRLVYLYRHQQVVDLSSPTFYIFSLLILIGFYLVDAYHPDSQIFGLRAPARIIISNSFIAIVIAALIYLSGTWGKHPFLARGTWLPTLALFSIWAIALRTSTIAWLRANIKQSHWLLLSNNDVTQFWQDFQTLNPLAQLTLLLEDHSTSTFTSELEYFGSFDDLLEQSDRTWAGVIVTPHLHLNDVQMQALMQMRLQGTPIYKLPDFYEIFWYKVPPNLLQDTWFTFSAGFNLFQDFMTSRIKRIFDLVIALLMLIALSPLMLLTAIAVKLDSSGPIFYSQLRTGLKCQPFRVYKFRSMYQDAEQRGVQWASQHDPRITRIGRWMRLMRIDELPQLWNVLRGDMSLIGPRPERPEFDSKLAEVIPYYEVRYLVKPGITGWAQVMYPYGASIQDAYEKMAYDLYYIKNYSIWLEIAIAFKTVRVVLLGKGR
jgi:exopolysaccharide biosynthesis polyprenyl glycosylphosphotransferase